MADETAPQTETGATPAGVTPPVPAEVISPQPDAEAPKSGKHFFKRFLAFYASKKKLTIPASVVLALAVLFAIPFTRYALAGTVIKQNYSVTVTDSRTGKPVSQALVNLGGVTGTTDNTGKAVIKAKVGSRKLAITKKYYKDYALVVTVPLMKQKSPASVKVEATGRQVPITVTNRISGKALENAVIKAAGTEAKTGKDGKAAIVVPAQDATLDAVISAAGYNEAEVSIKVTEAEDKANNFAVTPAGKLYFLSKQSGKIDVVKTNLDGSGRQTVLAGTGKEEDGNTVLLASRDWKYLAMQSRRDSDLPKLYLIETATNKLTTMDEGNATFALSGWIDDYFVYKVDRNTIAVNAGKRIALKSYKADTKQIAVLEENQVATTPNGYYYNNFQDIYLLDGRVVYTSEVYPSVYYTLNNFDVPGLKMTITSVKPDGKEKNVLKSFAPGKWVGTSWYKFYLTTSITGPKNVYARASFVTPEAEAYELSSTSIKQTNSEETNKSYLTYLLSPSAKAVFWYEPRDGKNTLFLGNVDAGDSKEVASLSEYVTYGWYTDDYLLVSKGGSELFIMPAAEKVDSSQILKISDYHKPNYSFNGYGGGYGGI